MMQELQDHNRIMIRVTWSARRGGGRSTQHTPTSALDQHAVYSVQIGAWAMAQTGASRIRGWFADRQNTRTDTSTNATRR
jgi:hypothetical protein